MRDILQLGPAILSIMESPWRVKNVILLWELITLGLSFCSLPGGGGFHSTFNVLEETMHAYTFSDYMITQSLRFCINWS